MPRLRLPPTPKRSTDIAAKEPSHNPDMESVFALPPPALQPAGVKSSSKMSAHSPITGHSSPPSSPRDKQVRTGSQRKRTLSGTNKTKFEPPTPPVAATDAALPPPPSRARKIIQMKPKNASSAAVQDQLQPSSKAAPPPEELNAKTTSTSKRKQAQPSTTTAAGRKIARKTAHSIIERRRRSKMNEEFGVLKDMIPACAGVEMHKLAILQAGIEYVRYLEGCIDKLKTQNGDTGRRRSTVTQDEVDNEEDDEEDEDEEEDDSMDIDHSTQQQHHAINSSSTPNSESDISSPAMTMRLPAVQSQQPLPPFRDVSAPTSVSTSAYTSPNLRPIQSASSIYHVSNSQVRPLIPTTQNQLDYSISPPPLTAQTPTQTGVSPAFGAIHFSPDLSRTSTWCSINGQMAHNKPSPNILPLPQAAVPLTQIASATPYGSGLVYMGQHSFGASEGQAEATATAALMMMTKDRRGSISVTPTGSSKGMSVRDLLTS